MACKYLIVLIIIFFPRMLDTMQRDGQNAHSQQRRQTDTKREERNMNYDDDLQLIAEFEDGSGLWFDGTHYYACAPTFFPQHADYCLSGGGLRGQRIYARCIAAGTADPNLLLTD
jgi:hypothetical protein